MLLSRILITRGHRSFLDMSFEGGGLSLSNLEGDDTISYPIRHLLDGKVSNDYFESRIKAIDDRLNYEYTARQIALAKAESITKDAIEKTAVLALFGVRL